MQVKRHSRLEAEGRTSRLAVAAARNIHWADLNHASVGRDGQREPLPGCVEALEEALGRAEEAEARAGVLEERANALESRVAQLEAQDGIVRPPTQVARGIGPLTYVVIGLGVVLVIFSSVVLNRTRRS